MLIDKVRSVDAAQLENIFASVFLSPYQTILVGGASEPLYLPKGLSCHQHIAGNFEDVDVQHHRIFYRHDYCTSLLHEVAHWCLAGVARRRLLDYGYWYAPDGRNAQQQREFEQVEIKPQALECLFSQVLGIPFRISVDNLALDGHDTRRFEAAVAQQAKIYRRTGMPKRAALFLQGLVDAS